MISILLPIIILFTCSFDLLYDLIKQLFQSSARLPSDYNVEVVKGLNVLTIENLNLLGFNFKSDKDILKYFNRLNNLDIYLYLDDIKSVNHFIQSAGVLKLYKNLSINWFFILCELLITMAIFGILFHIYKRVKLKFLIGWIFATVFTAIASVNILGFHKFEPSTKFIKLSYYLQLIILNSRNFLDKDKRTAIENGLVIIGTNLFGYLLSFFCKEERSFIGNKLILFTISGLIAIIIDFIMSKTFLKELIILNNVMIKKIKFHPIIYSILMIQIIITIMHWIIIAPIGNVKVKNTNTLIYYVEYVLIVIFITAVCNFFIEKKEIVEDKINEIELQGSLDIIRLETSKSPLIISVDLDNNIMVHNPFGGKSILKCDFWPINHIKLSDDGKYIVLINYKLGLVQCYEDLKLIWRHKNQYINKETKILNSFFRRKTIPGFLARRVLKSDSSSSLVDSNFPPVKEDKFEFIFVTNTQTIIYNRDGSFKNYPSPSPVLASALVLTPRVADRIVNFTEDKLIVGTIINNNLKFKELLFKETYNQLGQPLTRSTGKGKGYNEISIIPLYFGMIVIVKDFIAELVDVSTGIVIKKIGVGNFKPGSFRVTHSEFTHCKFCGSASINSLSIIYEDSGTLIVHNFKLDSKSKSNICLRVERDPREIRCQGFNNVQEQHWVYPDIIKWEITSVNTIMGISQTKFEIIQSNDTYKSNLKSIKKKTKKYESDLQFFVITLSDGIKKDYKKVESGTNVIAKYGFKSVVCNFGSKIEIFYLGNDKLIEEGEDLYFNNDLWTNELLFINKRRRRR
ncbi:unnamed protein product [Candida verbasci]|uniref:Uncharacterized protein n=1 Tax=Candida verbasci TaxID=1227364 RepID=A0A9W4U297_9ASCO|nr:unnamed protein product [Candida verbasci]